MASVLILLSLAMGAAGLLAFFWSMRDGQYDDLDGAAERIFLDDQGPATEAERVDSHRELPAKAGSRSVASASSEETTHR